ncbi:hypothetical protein M231_01924 [Tremella mesenterica]|uniref:BZIP domain-containing protein n=1 Tax=Tremella mesenterica TaxID=5217 RepID=A0A4Q1BS72_TREME|nr:hypothetical protein M231_01924 [Tremella mesenterica]
MASPPASLASLLAIPDQNGTNGSVQDVDPHAEEGTENAILNYLSETYANSHEDIPPAPSFRLSAHTQNILDAHITHPPRPVRETSPLNPTFTIPPEIAELASRATPVINVEEPTQEISVQTQWSDVAERGEMGGKRKKQPHERAGWKEMDESDGYHRKRTRRKKEEEGIFVTEGSQEEGILAIGPGTGDEAEGSKSNSKLTRAEQNRRAQQAFRRRREEHVKSLEAEIKSLQTSQARMDETQSKLKEVALSYESAMVERAALRRALSTLSQRTRTSFLTPSGELSLNPLTEIRRGEDSPRAQEEAFGLLERQCREVVKARRIGRVEDEEHV